MAHKYIKTLVFLITLSYTAIGQNRIDPTLEVRRDFDMKLSEITKGKLNTSVTDSLSRFDLDFNYSVINKPVRDLYEFSPLPSANIERSTGAHHPQFYARLGANLMLNPFATIKYQPVISPNTYLLIYGDHDSFHGKLPLFYNNAADNILVKSDEKIATLREWNRGGIKFEYNWTKVLFGLNISHDNSFRGFSGFEAQELSKLSFNGRDTDYMSRPWMKDSLSRRSGITAADIYLSSKNSNNNTLHYSAGASVSYLKDKFKTGAAFQSPLGAGIDDLTENIIGLNAALGYGFADHSKISVEVKYETSKFSYIDDRSRNGLEVYPHYTFKLRGWHFDLGVKYARWNDKYADITGNSLYLSGLASLELITNRLWLYGLIDGKNNLSSYHRLLAANPFTTPATPLRNTEQPIIINAGLKGNITDRISFNIYGGYEKYKNQLYFIKIGESTTNIINGFHPFYDGEKRSFFGGELFFKSKAVDAHLNVKSISFNTNDFNDVHYNYSPLEISGLLRYNWRERIILAADIEYRHKTPTVFSPGDTEEGTPYTMTNIPSHAVVNIEATYVFIPNLSFFVRGNNLLNTPFSPIPFYARQGAGVGIGVNVKF